MREYELYLPVNLNDGSPVDDQLIEEIGELLLKQFGGVTFFPQNNVGRWRMGNVEFRDQIVIFRVLAADFKKARRFFKRLKKRLMTELDQEDILIVEKDATSL